MLWSHTRGNIRPILQSAKRETCQKMIGSGDLALLLGKMQHGTLQGRRAQTRTQRQGAPQESGRGGRLTSRRAAKQCSTFSARFFWVGALVVRRLVDGARVNGLTPIANRGLLFGNRSRGIWTAAWKGKAPASYQESLLKSGPLRSRSRGKDWTVAHT